MNLGFPLEQVMLLILLLVRVTSFFLLAPVFGMRGVPVMLKIGLAFFVSLTILPMLTANQSLANLLGSPLLLALAAVKEVIVGLLMGYACMLLFSAIQAAGQLIDMQIGFSLVNVIDPQTGIHMPVLGSFKNLLAILLFLGLDGHFALITAIIQSFSFIPAGTFVMSGGLLEFFFKLFSLMILLAVKISMPVVIALFLTDIGFAVLARTVPQMNIFVVGMPLKLLLGFFVMILVMPVLIYFFQDLFHLLFRQVDTLLHIMGDRS